MSHQLIARNPDLQKLRDDGFHVVVRHGYLMVYDVPYVSQTKEIKRGTLFSTLELANNETGVPQTHVAYWTGEHPCHSDGSQISAFYNPSQPQDFGNGIRADHTFSAKASYRDYHHKMTAYIARIAGEARNIDASVRAETFPVYLPDDETSVFKYEDTASSRVHIGSMNAKLAGQRIGIIGLGGTGSYVLDFVTKTHVKEIHLFDGDIFLQHNAFRAPGAASGDRLKASKKVEFWAETYSAMRHDVVPHPDYLDENNLDQLVRLDFVFLCMDPGPAKAQIISALESKGLSFIDVGLGILPYDGNRLSGLLRVTTSTPANRETARKEIQVNGAAAEPNEYSTNIQVAELNALNAALAVIRWKKLYGFYYDSESEHHSLYMIRANEMANSGSPQAQ